MTKEFDLRKEDVRRVKIKLELKKLGITFKIDEDTHNLENKLAYSRTHQASFMSKFKMLRGV